MQVLQLERKRSMQVLQLEVLQLERKRSMQVLQERKRYMQYCS